MFNSKLKRLSGRLALAMAAVALMAAAGASAASAAPFTLSQSTELASEQEIEIAGTTVPAGTDDVAVAVCNMTGVPGTECDLESGTFGAFFSEGEFTAGFPILVRKGPWEGRDFTQKEFPPTGNTTTCRGALALEPCSVVVSFYDTTMFGPKQIGAETRSISFK